MLHTFAEMIGWVWIGSRCIKLASFVWREYWEEQRLKVITPCRVCGNVRGMNSDYCPRRLCDH